MATHLLGDILADLVDEFNKGDIYEAPLEADGWHYLGAITEDDRVYVDPAPLVVEILFHELLHRRYPRWGEKRVQRMAGRLLAVLSDKQKRQWYRCYQRSARKTIRPVVME